MRKGKEGASGKQLLRIHRTLELTPRHITPHLAALHLYPRLQHTR